MKRVFFIMVFIWGLSVAYAQQGKLTESEARGLVALALGKVARLPHFGLDRYDDPDARQFYVFEATAEHPRGGSPVIGHFAVNATTGAVWDLGVCQLIHSRVLSLTAAKVRKKHSVTDQEYRKLAAIKPCQPE